MHSSHQITHITDIAKLSEEQVAILAGRIPEVAARIRHDRALDASECFEVAFIRFRSHPTMVTIGWGDRPKTQSGAITKAATESAPRTFTLRRLVDIADLDESDLASFVRDLPALGATLRIALRASEDKPLWEMFPQVTFSPDIGDRVLVRTRAGTNVVSSGQVIAKDRAQTTAGIKAELVASEMAHACITRARRRM